MKESPGPPPEERYAAALRAFESYRQRQADGKAESSAEFLAAHEDLREILEALLRDDGGAEPEPEPDTPLHTVPDLCPERIGPYRVLTVLGEGGMGVVYLAEQDVPVKRRVALKVVKLGMDTKQVLARFDAERQALAMMNHPNIAKVLDAGATDHGRPYFVMELVKGLPITAYCDKHRLPVDERIRLFQQVARGVQHAHQKGVMHRDLKPSNILVAMQDGAPAAKIIDFGLARAMEHRLTERTLFTETGQVVGTPEYMSPEQAEMETIDVDTRTDVYSLGVLLYELLTGQLPFSAQELRQAGLLEIQRRIREDDPPKPSTRVSTQIGAPDTDASAHARNTTLAALQRELKGDLDWVVMKALEKDRVRRYQTAAELALDLQHFLDDEPVAAGPPGTGYRLRKFVHKYRREVVMVGALVVSLAVGLVVSVWLYLDAREQERQAVTAKNDAEQQRREAERSLANFDRVARLVAFNKLMAKEATLWPEVRTKVEDMQRWLAAAELMAAELPAHRGTLDALRARARSREPEVVFDDARDQYLHDGLTSLVTGLDALVRPERGTIANVRRRLEFASNVERLSVENRREDWNAATAAIRMHPRYGGLDLKPHLGLVPLEPDPASRLWEFAHLRSGERPLRDAATGRWIIEEATGLVFVLIPGGESTMGAQREDPAQPNYDPEALPNERGPLRPVRVDPFFVAKYEMTQAQWLRLADLERDENPAHWKPGGTGPEGLSLTHPIENVSWMQCRNLLGRHGLDLPSEAQWEYACRAHATTPYWSGDRESLRDVRSLNVADEAAAVARFPVEPFAGYDDTAPVTARVGSYAANPFGLHDVHGNVMEWCRNPQLDASGEHVARGGSFYRSVSDARSSRRVTQSGESRFFDFGVRPARRVE